MSQEEELQEDETGDDVCDLCFTSGVNVSRATYCGKTIGIECGCEDTCDGTCERGGCEECEECEKSFAEDGDDTDEDQ